MLEMPSTRRERSRITFKDDHRQRLGLGMGEGKSHVTDSEFRCDFGGAAMKFKSGPAGRQVNDFEIAPRDAAGPTGAERLHAGFLGGEASRVTLRAVGLAVGVSDFIGREDAFKETPSVPRDGFFDARNFAQVNAAAEDHCDKGSEEGISLSARPLPGGSVKKPGRGLVDLLR